jgi:hypothetical protein
MFCTPLLPIFNLNYKKILFDFTPDSNLQIVFVFFWLTIAAGLYQIDYLFNKVIFSRDLLETAEEAEKVFVPAQVIVETPNNSGYVTQQQPQGDRNIIGQQAVGQQAVGQQEVGQQEVAIAPKESVNRGNLPKKVLTFLIITVGSIWVYMFINLPQVKEAMYVNQVTYQSSPQTATENPASESKKTTKLDSFEAATKKADSASRLMKIAQSPEEWTLVVNQWEDAITLMKEVPARHPNYGLATQKVRDYQLHLEFAKQYGLN